MHSSMFCSALPPRSRAELAPTHNAQLRQVAVFLRCRIKKHARICLLSTRKMTLLCNCRGCLSHRVREKQHLGVKTRRHIESGLLVTFTPGEMGPLSSWTVSSVQPDRSIPEPIRASTLTHPPSTISQHPAGNSTAKHRFFSRLKASPLSQVVGQIQSDFEKSKCSLFLCIQHLLTSLTVLTVFCFV